MRRRASGRVSAAIAEGVVATDEFANPIVLGDLAVSACTCRHPDVTCAGADEEAGKWYEDYRGLTGRSLLTMSAGVCQQTLHGLDDLRFRFRSHGHVLPADRAEHELLLNVSHQVRSTHLALLSEAINQLIALEHVVAVHVAASVSDIEAHEATDCHACVDCEFTQAEFGARDSGPAFRGKRERRESGRRAFSSSQPPGANRN